MRKKVVLIAHSDPDKVSELAYMLRVQGYAVIAADTREAAVNRIRETPVHVVITWQSMEPISGMALIEEIRSSAVDFDIRSVLLIATENQPAESHADIHLPETITSTDLLDRLRTLTATKRVPRKGARLIRDLALAAAVALLFFVAATIAGSQSPSAAKAVPPVLSGDQLAAFFKAKGDLSDAQDALDRAKQQMSRAIADLGKACGEQFQPQIDQNPGPHQGYPVCAPKPAPPPDVKK